MFPHTIILGLEITRHLPRITNRMQKTHQLPIFAGKTTIHPKLAQACKEAPSLIIAHEISIKIFRVRLVTGDPLDIVRTGLHGDEAIHEDSSSIRPKLDCLSRVVGWDTGDVMDGDSVGNDVFKVMEVEMKPVAYTIIGAYVCVERCLAEAAVSCVI